MNGNLMVSPSPHIKSSQTTQKIMLDVVIALCPTIIAAGIIFGLQAIVLITFCTAACVVFEYLSQKVFKTKTTISDLSAVVTGIILAFNLPVTMPLWMAAIGCFIAIFIVKQMFGGIGNNFANPAITARIVLFLSFTKQMSNYVEPFFYTKGVDAVASPTVLQKITEGSTELPSYLEMFFGIRGGSIGETCIFTLLLGGIYLVAKRVINPATPLAFIGTALVFSLLFGKDPAYQLMSGGLILGAIFMATDYATTPMTTKGKIIFGIGCGLVTMVIRCYGNMPEGVSFSILLMNVLTPIIDRFTKSRPHGIKKEVKQGAK